MSSFNIYDHASQKQIDNFKPTFLYIKQHTITRKLYFGKTVKKIVEKYNGSGTYWTNHTKKYGIEYIETIWYCLFNDIETLVQSALLLSDIHNIVESENWANLIIENGLSGGSCPGMMSAKDKDGNYFRVECKDIRLKTRELVSINSGIKKSEIACENNRVGQLNRAPFSSTHRENLSNASLGVSKTVKHRQNISLGQMNRSSETITKYLCAADNLKHTWEVTHPSGQTEIIVGLNKFCKEYNLSPGNMCGVADGNRLHHKNFLCKRL